MIQEIIRPIENPIKKTAHIQILYGNVAPQGSVAKITGKEGLYFSGEPSHAVLLELIFFKFILPITIVHTPTYS